MFKFKTLAVILGLLLLALPQLALADSIYVLDAHGALIQPQLPPKTVVLTFDDGPSAYTSQILAILQSNDIKATFFVIGQEALGRDTLKTIYADGDEIGNHTYSHPNLAELPAWQVQLELGLNRLIIESQIQHSTRIFRPPFLGSDSLSFQSEDLIKQVDQYGYVTAGEDIDSTDWQRPGVDAIVSNATIGDSGGIILMHDGGGDRSQTVQALPRIIEYYRARGYRFTTISGALGLSRDQLMPRLTTGDTVLSAVTGGVIEAYALAGRWLYWVILGLIVVSFGRMALVIAAAVAQSRRKYPPPVKDMPCSIIVPAYNEAVVIRSCLKSILASDYRAFELIVVDDGSRDNTFELASSLADPRLKVVRQQNSGKAAALNYGIKLAQTELIVAIDADTVFRPETLSLLMRHFQNPVVGAVSGNTRVANRGQLLTKLQSIEYVVGFNLDRRMGDLFDCITVVPGAIGAFRKAAIMGVGGFAYDTLAEDADLTIAIKMAGYRIVYDAKAIAYTEAPTTIKDLLKQRFRWSFGTMQAVWKHRQALLNPRYKTLGLVGLPYLVFFQILFPLLSPLFDAAVVFGLLAHQYHLVVVSFVIYTVADILMLVVALALDNEKMSQLWLIVPQRILYRQLMYYVIARSTINVLRGNLVGWGAVKREGHALKNASE